jgi:hypothetical protein
LHGFGFSRIIVGGDDQFKQMSHDILPDKTALELIKGAASGGVFLGRTHWRGQGFT